MFTVEEISKALNIKEDDVGFAANSDQFGHLNARNCGNTGNQTVIDMKATEQRASLRRPTFF